MTRLSPYQIYAILPKTNCRLCGRTCLAFAADLVLREARVEDCPPLNEKEFEQSRLALEELLGPDIERESTGLAIDREKCTGCGICVMVCEINAEKIPAIMFGQAPPYKAPAVLLINDGEVDLVNPE